MNGVCCLRNMPGIAADDQASVRVLRGVVSLCTLPVVVSAVLLLLLPAAVVAAVLGLAFFALKRKRQISTDKPTSLVDHRDSSGERQSHCALGAGHAAC